MSSLNWIKIVSAAAPINLDAETDHFRFNKNNIYQINNSFMYCLVHKRISNSTVIGNFAVIFYWMTSELAVKKRCFEDIVVMDFSNFPPKELPIDGWRWTYENIIDSKTSNNFKISPVLRGGKEFYIGVHMDRYGYYFDSIIKDRPFAISVDLRGIKWTRCD
jgi:hypothetical protein